MTQQFSVSVRNAILAAIESTISTSPKWQYFSGPPPANCAASDTGTKLLEMSLPSDWMAAPSGGSAAKSGTWSGTAIATGTIGHYRVKDSAGTTCHDQGIVTQAFSLATSAGSTSSNVLTFTSTTGVTAGMSVSGTGVPSGATVDSTTSTTVTLTAVATVSSGATIFFGDTSGDHYIANTSVTSGVTTLTITTRTLIAPGA